MQNTKFTLSLSRWHHVATRLRTLAQKLTDEAQATLGATRVSSPIDEEQESALTEQGLKALDKVQQIVLAHEGLAMIRTQLAKKNADMGVADKLALVETLRQEKTQLTRLAAINLITMPAVQKANDALAKKPAATEAQMWRGRDVDSSGVVVRLVPIGALEGVHERIRVIELDIQELTDEMSDINRGSMTIELPNQVAQLVNLAHTSKA